MQDGVWIKGLFLEGAGWEKKASCLVEANPMQLVCPMPTIHFKPVETKRRSAKGELASSVCVVFPSETEWTLVIYSLCQACTS